MINIYKIESCTDFNRFKKRYKETRKKLILKAPVLDACSENFFAKLLAITNFTKGDLNFNTDFTCNKSTFQTITSFEVIEHLQNPLTYLKSINQSLRHNGTLYLTTPVKSSLDLLKGKYHWKEFTKEELIFLLKYAGFEKIKIEQIRTYQLRHVGIRPLIRKVRDMLFGQTFFIIATKK